MFRPVPPDADFVTLEEAELARWAEHRVFERSVAQRDGAEPWVFYEGPPTANGRPGLHHVWARVYKDLFCRYRTMRGLPGGPPGRLGYPRPAGRGGGREEARHHRQAPDRGGGRHRRVHPPLPGVGAGLRRRLAAAHRAHRLLGRPRRRLLDVRPGLRPVGLVAPKAPFRPGPALRGPEGRPLLPPLWHRAVQPRARPAGRLRATRRTSRPTSASVWSTPTRRSSAPGGSGGATSLVVWTTTPWTLLVQHRRRRPSRPRLTRWSTGCWSPRRWSTPCSARGRSITHRVVGRRAGRVCATERPFDEVAVRADAGADWLAGRAGRLRHHRRGHRPRPPGPGLRRGRPAGRPCPRPARRSTLSVPTAASPRRRAGWPGELVREANHEVNDRLEADGLLVRRQPYLHSYPHCWRCGTPLIYWGKPSWYVATSTRKADLVAANQTVDWHPAHIRDGRFGEWLEQQRRLGAVAGPVLGDAAARSGGATTATSTASARSPSSPTWPVATCRDIDPHRPAIDEVAFDCPDCAAMARPSGGGAGPSGRAGHRRLVRLRVDARRAGRLSPCAQVPRRSSTRLPGRLHHRGHRPDPGLVLLAAGRQHAGRSRADAGAVPARHVPRPHRRRRRAQDVEVGRQRHRPVGDPRRPAAPTRCGGGCSARARRGRRPG